jgi:hypothetical protein
MVGRRICSDATSVLVFGCAGTTHATKEETKRGQLSKLSLSSGAARRILFQLHNPSSLAAARRIYWRCN